MSISSVKTGEVGTSLLVGNTYYLPTSFESIATATASGGETNFTFSSISQDYKHLQIRTVAQRSGTTNVGFVCITLNNDTSTSKYTYHYVHTTNGSAVSAYGLASGSYGNARGVYVPGNQYSTNFGSSIINILDYSSSNKFKTIKHSGGFVYQGTAVAGVNGYAGLVSNLYLDTTAVNRVDVSLGGDTFSAGSIIALYGIKG
jgi:hypothetical protein